MKLNECTRRVAVMTREEIIAAALPHNPTRSMLTRIQITSDGWPRRTVTVLDQSLDRLLHNGFIVEAGIG